MIFGEEGEEEKGEKVSSTSPFVEDPSSSHEDEIYTHVLIDDEIVLPDPVEVVGRLLVLQQESSNRFGGAGRRREKLTKVSFDWEL